MDRAIATAEVEIIADTRRFVTDLRRKLRAALAGVGDDVGADLVTELRGIGQQIGRQLEREVNNRVIPRFNRAMERAGRQAAQRMTNVFDDEFELEEVSVRKAIAAADAMDRAFEARFARNFARYEQIFEDEFDLEQAAVRKAIAAAEAMDAAFEARFARNFDRYEDIFEDEFDLEQAAFRKAVAAADAMDAAFEQQFAVNFERRGEQAAQALANGIQSQQNQVANAFGDILNAIDDRQRQAQLRARQNGGNLALAFSQGVQRGAQQAADDAADALANTFENTLGNRLRLVFSRVLDLDDLFDGSRPAINRATQALRGFGDALSNVARQITIVPLQNLGNLFSDLTTNMASAAAMALFFLGALDQLAGLLFALPATLSLITAGVATIIVAFNGAGEAFGAAGDSAEDFEGTIADLAPALQGAAREFRALNDDFDQLQLDAQQALWSRLDGAITAVADNLMGPLHEGIVDASGALGDFINEIAEFLSEAETADTVRAIFDSLVSIFQSLGEEIQPLLRGLRTLVNEFLPSLRDVEEVFDGIGTAFERWADEVTTTDLASGLSPAQDAFRNALDLLGQLWRITVNVAEAVGSVFDAGRRNGTSFLDLLERISEEIADAFASPEGQETIADFLGDLLIIVDEVLRTLGEVFQQFPKIADPLADIAEEIGPDLRDFINELGDALAVFLEEAAPGFEELASALGELDLQDIANNLGDAFSNVAPFLHEMIDMFGDIAEFITIIIRLLSFVSRGIVEFARGFVFLQEVFNEIRNIDGILAGIGDFFSSFGTRVADGFDDALTAAGIFFDEFGPRVADGFQDALDDAGEFFDEFGPRVADGFDDAVQAVVDFGQRIGRGAAELFSPIGDAAADLGDTVATFFTETLPSLVDLGMTVVLDFITTKWEEIRQGWDEFWNGLGASTSLALSSIGVDISAGLDGIIATITGWINTGTEMWNNFWTELRTRAKLLLDGIGIDISGSLTNVRSTFSGWQTGIATSWNNFWTGLGNRVTNAWNAITSTVSTMTSRVRSTISGWISGVRSSWNNFWSGLSSTVSSQFSSISSRVSNALSSLRNAFSSFASGVRNIWNGLLDAIRSVADSIRNVVSSITNAVSNALSAASSLANIDINPFADGGIVDRPTIGLVGEAGREVIIPMTRPQRAVELVQQSGLLNLMASQGLLPGLPAASGVTSERPIEIHVNSQTADPEQVARRTKRLLLRELQGRGLERTA